MLRGGSGQLLAASLPRYLASIAGLRRKRRAKTDRLIMVVFTGLMCINCNGDVHGDRGVGSQLFKDNNSDADGCCSLTIGWPDVPSSYPTPAPDLLKRHFSAAAPNEKSISDISFVWTDEGWLYLAAVMDLYSRAIAGWSMNRRMMQQLVSDALAIAQLRRHFTKGTIIRSDRGRQYRTKRNQRLIKTDGLRCSIGRKAFRTLKVVLAHRERYATGHTATSGIFAYIATHFNRQRKHFPIGHQIPMQFEKAA